MSGRRKTPNSIKSGKGSDQSRCYELLILSPVGVDGDGQGDVNGESEQLFTVPHLDVTGPRGV